MGKPFARGLGSDSLDATPHEPVVDVPTALANGSSSGILAEEFDFKDSVLASISGSAKIEALIAAAMAGKLPRNRPLKSYEPEKLNPRHISVVMMRAVGYRNKRIAEIVGYEESVVSYVLGHPDSRTILAAILTEAAVNAVNLGAEVQRRAPAMLKIVGDIAEDEEKKTPDRLKAAFKWLDMYSDGQKGEKGEKKPLDLTSEAADRLSTAIREASEAQEVPYVMVGSGEVASGDSPSLDPASLPAGAPDSVEKLHQELEQVLSETPDSAEVA